MSDLHKTPGEELLSALSEISEEEKLYNDWFVRGFSIGEAFEDIFDAPHINWDTLAPNSKQTRSYAELFDIMNELYSDKYRRAELNGHISIDAVEADGRWRLIPSLARELRDAVERELAERQLSGEKMRTPTFPEQPKIKVDLGGSCWPSRVAHNSELR